MPDDIGVEQWAKECHGPTGLCGNSEITNWCAGKQPCYGGSVGDFNIQSKTPAQLAKSKTKFWGTNTKDGKLKLIEVGMLADAGLQKGDVLVGVLTSGDTGIAKIMNMGDDRKDILHWRFTDPDVVILYERNAATRAGLMSNPHASKSNERR